MTEEKLHLLALHLMPGIGPVHARQLISYCGSAQAVFELPHGKLLKIPGIGSQTIAKIKQSKGIQQASDTFQKAQQHDLQLAFITEPDYPKRLKQIPDAPLVLFYKGNPPWNNQKIISIVGTRKSTEYGRNFTEKLIESLSPYQPLIVSGLAYGIDITAHRAALHHQLPTLSVLANGLDTIYPPSHRETAQKIVKSGGLISEQPPNVKPEGYLFPIRNRIIAGLSDVVIIVEAARKGGAMITAHYAFDYNREIFAVPGDINRTYSAGCNHLIKTQKAHLCTGLKDIEYIMNWSTEKSAPQQDITQWLAERFSGDEKLIIETLLDQQHLAIDELSLKTQLSINRTASLLLTLECQGVIKALPGKRFKLNC